MHHKRKLITALIAAGAITAGLGSSVFSADAKQRTFVITFLGGIQHTVTVDAGVDTPLDQVKLPGIDLPILSVREITPPDAPSSTGLPNITIQPGAPQDAPAPGAPQADPTGDEPTAEGNNSKEQETTGNKKRKPRPGEQILDTAGNLLGKEDTPEREQDRPIASPLRNADGTPTADNPTMSLALPGPAPVGVPNFFIDKFRIPPFLLPIYQAAGIQYGVRWEVLAAINEIETDYGRNLNISSAGAMGWMQFIPSSWKRWGTDANNDGKKDPYNPVDAIFAAARYLRAAGADKNLGKAIFAYNHADWYVDSVLLRARLIGGLPSDLIGSLSGLTQGHFPVAAKSRYADDINERDAERRIARGKNAALPVNANKSRRGINIYAKPGSPVTAVQDGKITKVGTSARLGKYVQMEDVYGNTYTYGNLKKIAAKVAVPKRKTQTQASIAKELALPKREAAPTAPASAGEQSEKVVSAARKKAAESSRKAATPVVKVVKERLYANPGRKAIIKKGGSRQIENSAVSLPDNRSFDSYFTEDYGLRRDEVELKTLTPGRRIIAGTILGRIGTTSPAIAPHTLFEIRPSGRGAPRIDPKPILDGWKLLESTAIYRAQGKNPFYGSDARQASIGQILLMSKETLQQRVLADPRIEVYSCGRRDIKAGSIDRRALATLSFLAASGLKPTVTSLRCGHGFYTASGNVSEHSSGNAIDIAKINGIPILGNQGKGSITDITIRRLLTLQGTMKPHQIISLMTYQGSDNTMAMPDHADHIHVGFQPQFDARGKLGKQVQSVLKPTQWIKLIDRLGEIDNPTVRLSPSKYSINIPTPKRASGAHKGE